MKKTITLFALAAMLLLFPGLAGSGESTGGDQGRPSHSEEVTFQSGDIVKAGTLTMPKKPGRHPAVVMLTGSGPMNRDQELFGWKMFRDIADHFTRHGLAVLRSDDRGVGGSTGSTFESTTTDFANDALAAVRYLQSRSDINGRQIGLCGHSEGGAVGPLAASQSRDVAFVVAMAGFSAPGLDIALKQLDLNARAMGVPEKKNRARLDNIQTAIKMIRQGRDKAAVIPFVREIAAFDIEFMPEPQRKRIKDLDAFLKKKTNSLYDQYTSPWFRFFIRYNPAPALEKMTCPLLAIFGGRDVQVPAELNEKALLHSLLKGKHQDFTVKVFPRANHVFQKANTGSESEYPELPKQFVPGFLDYMTAWIIPRVDIAP